MAEPTPEPDPTIGAALRDLAAGAPRVAPARAIMARGRARRLARRQVLASAAAAALVVVGLTATVVARPSVRDDQSVSTDASTTTSDTAGAPAGDRVAGLGTIFFPDDGPPMLCHDVMPGDGASLCTGAIPMAGVTPDQVDTTRTGVDDGSVSSWSVDVIGTFDGTTLTVLGPPLPHLGPGWAFNPDPGTAESGYLCGDATVTGPSDATGRDHQLAVDLARSDPAFAAEWLMEPGPGFVFGAQPFPDWSRRVAVFTFATDDLASREAALRTVFDGPMCLATVGHTDDQLAAIEAEAREARPRSPVPFGTLIVPQIDRVALTVTYADAATTQQLLALFPPGSVEVRGWLRPTADEPFAVPGDLRDLDPGQLLVRAADGRTVLGYVNRSDFFGDGVPRVFDGDDRLIGSYAIDQGRFIPHADGAPTDSDPP